MRTPISPLISRRCSALRAPAHGRLRPGPHELEPSQPKRPGDGLWGVARSSWLVLALASGACASASFSQGIFDDGVVRYRIGEPGTGWQRVEVGDNDLAFHHREHGTISVNAICHDYDDVPEQALMNQLLFGMRDRDYRVEETVTLDGRGAMHDVVDLTLDGVPLTLEVFLVKKDGCVYDLTRTSSRGDFEAGRADFTRVVHGFQVLRTTLH